MKASEREIVKADYGHSLGRSLASRSDFIQAVGQAAQCGRALAAGRLVYSPQYWLACSLLDQGNMAPIVRRTLQAQMRINAELNAGIFPADERSMQAFVEFYVPHVEKVDWLGLTLDQPQRELPVLKHYGFESHLAYYQDFVPDRSVPSNPARCYLQHLAGKRVLIVWSFANVLRARATEVIFEAVWAKTGKHWFCPATVEALEFPYGFEPDTQQKFGTAINLFEHVASQMSRLSFDVALIAASGLAIPLDSAARQMGKIAIDLGGDLQIVFGVLGNRWRARADWQRDYFNEWWIDVPPEYQPTLPDAGDGKSYW